MYILSNNKSDALLINYWFGYNYGASIVAFALQHKLNSLNFKSRIISYVPNKFSNLYPGSFCEDFANKYLNLTHKIKHVKDLKKLNSLTETFITGSDQIFNYRIYNTHGGNAYQLNFSEDNKRKISCAGSFGFPCFVAGEAQKIIFKALLERFNFVSVRENEAKVSLEKQFGIKSDVICDPVFSISKDEWLSFCENNKNNIESYCACYFLVGGYNDKRFIEIESLIEVIKNKYCCYPVRLEFKKNYSCLEWLNYIANSKIVVTDSCHAVYFSIIFNKPLIYVKTNEEKFIRIKNALERFNYKAFVVERTNFEEAVNNISVPDNNYDYVNKRIEREKENFENWIINAMESKFSNLQKNNIEEIRQISLFLDEKKENMLKKEESLRDLFLEDEKMLEKLKKLR